jgi:hypothetical protein
MKQPAACLLWVLIACHPTAVAAQTATDASVAAAPADTSRLFIGPTGRMLAPGQGYVSVDAILLVTAQVGVTPYFSIGAGTHSILFLAGARTFWVTPKVRVYHSDRASVAAGLANIFIPGVGHAGLAYGVGTFGTLDASVTVGGGALYAVGGDPRDASGTMPVVVIGGERRFRPRVSFLTENYAGAHGGLVSAGVRWRLPAWQISLGGMVPFGRDFAVPGIWFSFAYKFGG